MGSHNGNMGCNGGLMDNGFKGIDTEKGYKYVSGTGTVPKCNVKKEHKHIVNIDGFKDVPPNNEKALEKAVTMQPVAVAIEADHQSFQLYKGVFSTPRTAAPRLTTASSLSATASMPSPRATSTSGRSRTPGALHGVKMALSASPRVAEQLPASVVLPCNPVTQLRLLLRRRRKRTSSPPLPKCKKKAEVPNVC